jgi:hypothetical protein
MPTGVVHMKKACSAVMWYGQLGKIWFAFGQHENEYTGMKKNKYIYCHMYNFICAFLHISYAIKIS